MTTNTERFEIAPLAPAAPEDLHFESAHIAWILSRYRDVWTALRSSDLSQDRPSPASTHDSRVKPALPKKHSDGPSAFLSFHFDDWQITIKMLASVSLRKLRTDQPVDLVSQFIRPWCLDSALAFTGIEPRHREYLNNLISGLAESDAAPYNANLKTRASVANRELDYFFQGRTTSSSKSMFLGLAQTLPAFLASAWAALLQHPSQVKDLQRHPGWIPRATEELLRYAGPVHTLFRRADRDTEICGTKIERGDRLILRLSSANRDPLQFPEPDRLDLTRNVAGHVALSAGSHYCAGASLVRMTTAVATQVFLERYVAPEITHPVEWSCGTMLIWPSSLPVLLGNAL